MKQKMGGLTALTVLLLTLCIGAGAFLLPRLLEDGPALPEPAPALPGTGLWTSMAELPVEVETDANARELAKAEKAALRELIVFARENRVETLYWEIGDGEDYARLETLCRTAKGSPAVWAAVRGVYAPEKPLKYAPEGVALQGEGLSGGALQSRLEELRQTGLPLALRYDAAAADAAETAARQSSGVQRLLPVLPQTAGAEYTALADGWEGLTAPVTPVVKTLQSGVTGSQLWYNARNGCAAGLVLGNYPEIRQDTAARGLLLSYADAAASEPVTAVSLEIARELKIGYPENNAATGYSGIFIMGTSDPDRPLTMNGKPVERTGTQGCFGVAVNLAVGNNTFTFRQGEDSLTLTVRRTAAGSGVTSTVTSRFPTSDAAVWAGQELVFRCVAPSGGKVTATINGQTVTMKQTAATAKNGIAATFQGVYQVPEDLPAGELTDWGSIAYTLTYNGKTTRYESAGRLYAAGAGVTPSVRADTENVSLLSDYTDDSTIQATYHLGARIPMVACFQYNGTVFYEVAGGYISSDRATVDPQVSPVETTVTGITSATEGRLTTVTFACGSFPAATAALEDGVLRVCLENTALPEKTDALLCPAVTEARWEQTQDGACLLLTLDEEKYWGYDIQYNEAGDVLLSIKEAPTLARTPGKPLEGVTVMIDPGHGNYDCGAYGAAGLYGPTESELNLAVSLALRERLEQMGATVLMTRTADDRETPKVTLDERVRMAVEAKPDFFLSVHHNSTGLTKEVKADWMVSYYCEGPSEAFARQLSDCVAAATGRKTDGAEWGYYYVTRLGFCPAVLYEVGFIPNPAQYEDCADWETICRTASGMAEAILQSVPAN